MIVFDEKMNEWSRMFCEHFHYTIPLRQIPRRVENEELIDAIRRSIEANEDLLPVIFGYGGDEGVEH